eukprot:958019-Alexandrium_andersonii.AAC.1
MRGTLKLQSKLGLTETLCNEGEGKNDRAQQGTVRQGNATQGKAGGQRKSLRGNARNARLHK